MKTLVRIAETAPCRNEKTSSVVALKVKRSGPPKLATPPLVSMASTSPASFGVKCISINAR